MGNSQQSMTKYFILSELSRHEMHGYDIMDRLEKITGKRPSPSQVYPVLVQMRHSGYLTVKAKSSGKKRMKYYKLTSSGRDFFSLMNKKFEIIMRSVLKEKIKICAHCGCEMLSRSYRKKISGKYLNFCCHSCAASYHK